MEREHLETNLRNWNERAAIHARSKFYDVEGFVADRNKLWLHPSEPAELGDVRGRSLCQLQCHLGLETLSWARLGAARVVGLDFSAPALAVARDVAERCGLGTQAHFVEADLHDAAAALAGHAPFDIVYVSIGAICWLPNIERWATVVSALLGPSGVLYMREVHPMLNTLEERDGKLEVAHAYFEATQPLRWESAQTYADPQSELQNRVTFDWSHGTGQLLSALLARGFTIELYDEHRDAPFCAFPCMLKGDDGQFRLPAALADRVPLTFSLRARKRAAP